MTKKNLPQLFDEFLFECEFVGKVRPYTIHCYRQTFLLFIKIIPEVSAETLTASTVIRFFKILQERERIVGKGIIKQGIKKSTVATYWNKLNPFFKWLEKKGHIDANPFAELHRPSPNYEDKKFLKKNEVEKIIAAVHTKHDNRILILKRNIVLFYIFLFCGLRKQEAVLLQIRDIDFNKKILTVRKENSKSDNDRQLPLHSSLLMHLKDYLLARKDYTTPYLFVSNKRDDRLSENGLKHLVNRIKNYSGVHFHLHQLRHTFAVNFLKHSNNIAKLKQLLGHKSLSMTLTYLRCLPITELRGDVEGMNIDTFV